MEKLSRSISKGLSRSLSTSTDVNKFWRGKTSYNGFDGGRSMRTAQFGERPGMFSRIKKLFTFARSEGNGAKKTSKKARQASKVSTWDDEFQNRMLFEIYKNMSSSVVQQTSN